MLRFFNIHLGADSTAQKILLMMKDLYRQEDVYQQEKFSQKDGYLFCDSSNISNKDFLVKQLSQALSYTIYYQKYKILSENEKNNIRGLIAKNLFNVTKYYFTTYEIKEWDDQPWGLSKMLNWTRRKSGMSFSVEDSHIRRGAIAINFPNELFSNMVLLQNCIHDALIKEYRLILCDDPIANLVSTSVCPESMS